MLKHIIKISLRNLSRTRLYSFINILGLTLGIACAILIIFFVKDELTFDRFHSKKERLFRLFYEAERIDGTLNKSPMVPIIMGDEILANYPEAEAKTIWFEFNSQVEEGGDTFEESLHMVDSSFLSMFDFKVISGTAKGALDEPGDLVITKSMALKIFGKVEVAGNSLAIVIGPGKKEFIVSAVVEDAPSNSSFHFNFLLNTSHAKDIMPEEMMNSWNFVASETYVLLQSEAEMESLAAKLPALVERAIGDDLEGRTFTIGLQSIGDMHLDTDMPSGLAPVSDPKYTLILSAICFLILVMACINFMNLSLGRSFGRAREIGVKKVVGVHRSQLVSQFLGEAIILSLISLAIALIAAYFALPFFNQLSGKELSFNLNIDEILLFTGLAILVGILAGAYPAMVVSGFKPVNILKGNLMVGQGRQNVRKGLITLQLILSVFLITTVLFMKNQLNYLQSKNLGFNREQVVVLPITVNDTRGFMDVISKGWDKAKRGQRTFKGLSTVESVGISCQNFEEGTWMEGSYVDAQESMHRFFFNVVDPSFIETLEMEMVAGRNFREEDQADERRSVIVNEAFVKEFNLTDPVGKRIPHEEFQDHEIIGVVKDFNFASLHNKVGPLALVINPQILLEGIHGLSIHSSVAPRLMVRLRAGQTADGLADIRETWNELFPEDPINLTFLDDTIQAQYEREGNLNTIIVTATIISVLIGSLGLFGLAVLTMNARRKEIGIRKVLGAGIGNMVIELSKSYLLLVIIATLLSIPLTYYFVSSWLDNFEFKIPIDGFTYLGGGLILFGVAFMILVFQSARVLRDNPIEALRSE
ncbi:ABC transporter permease [Fulvivirga sedimenti]|uniref:ABC transporter permease n=1 Tax=Fulvivirga sedimenti TaxID=2879465 RepID=A0A9X1HQA3_9BACT|nr:ABC transporter permease [Fulvivirga sedimenti]MCA6074819.1 ABC transporter permease [Fulvivirga sedimenti]MCA6075996.1 ABC transporter permease [Fulvivirga sedimenti]MCA6077124.1 ABC transporter permease [Fulvivirga sedimenti]